MVVMICSSAHRYEGFVYET